MMHFDVIVSEDSTHEKAIEYGKKYIESAGQEGQRISQE